MELTELQLSLWKLMSQDDRRSVRELQRETGASSTSVVRNNLLRLAKAGVLAAPPHGQARSWRCLKKWEG